MRSALSIFLWLAFAAVAGAEAPMTVDRSEFDRLWRVASERMPPAAPPLVIETARLIREHGEIWVDHEFLVDEDGRPSNYRLHSIEPAVVDPRPFMAMAMFLRYRPVDGVSATAVRFRDRERFRMPSPAVEGEE